VPDGLPGPGSGVDVSHVPGLRVLPEVDVVTCCPSSGGVAVRERGRHHVVRVAGDQQGRDAERHQGDRVRAQVGGAGCVVVRPATEQGADGAVAQPGALGGPQVAHACLGHDAV